MTARYWSKLTAVGVVLGLLAVLLPWMAGTASAGTNTYTTDKSYPLQVTWSGGQEGCAYPAAPGGAPGTVGPRQACVGPGSGTMGGNAQWEIAAVQDAQTYYRFWFTLTGAGTFPTAGHFLCYRYRYSGGGTYYQGKVPSASPGSSEIITVKPTSTQGPTDNRLDYWWIETSGTSTSTACVAANDPGIPTPDTNPALAGSLTCSRVLSVSGDGTNFATFKGAQSGQSGVASIGYSWDFGDGSTPSAGITSQHIYGATEAMPEGGWIATLTATYTASAGYTFGGAATTTQTCLLRVDYLNPSQSDAMGGYDTGDDDDCPTGFGWLNPLAIVSILECLFIPSESSLQSAADLYDTTTSEVLPFSALHDVVTFIPDTMREIADGAAYGYGSRAACAPLAQGFGTDGVDGVWGLDLPGQPPGDSMNVGNDALLCKNHEGGMTGSYGSWIDKAQMFLKIILTLFTALAVYHFVGQVIG